MKNVLFLLFIMAASIVNAQTPTSNDEANAKKAQTRANQVAAKLKLDTDKTTALFNVFNQTEQRISDLGLGAPDYETKIGYIYQEQNEMLKAALSADEYKIYEKQFSSKDKDNGKKLTEKNKTFVEKKATKEEKEKEKESALMKRDKEKAEKEYQKEQDTIKKAQQKEKDKAEKEAQKAKEKAKKEEKKAKELAKKEAEKAKKEEKKAKELAKKEAKKVK